MKNYITLFISAFLIFDSCKTPVQDAGLRLTEGRVPVTVTHAGTHDMKEAIDLNATSVFMLKTFVKSNTNGYLQEVNVQPGEYVSKGRQMFVIRSKESENIGNTVMALDTSFHFRGLIAIVSPGNGYVTELACRSGDYVQDGETLAAISDANSLVFMLELPYELRPYLPGNKTVELTLPDGQKITGNIGAPMPVVDPVSQTQNYIIRIAQARSIPENLVVKVTFIKERKTQAVALPKGAILTNEVQSEFWIMRMTDSTTAVKVPVTRGIETTDSVEILSPVLTPSDIILLTGNYGLPDTAKVIIEDKERE